MKNKSCLIKVFRFEEENTMKKLLLALTIGIALATMGMHAQAAGPLLFGLSLIHI